MSAATVVRGKFSALELPSVLRDVMSRLPEGRVLVSQGDSTRGVWFKSGTVRMITSSADEERLGAWLVHRRLLERDAWEEARRAEPREERLPGALLRLEIIDIDKLRGELETLTINLAAKMLFEGGQFEADDSWTAPTDGVSFSMSPAMLFVQAIRRTPDIEPIERAAGGNAKWMARSRGNGGEVRLVSAEELVLGELTSQRTRDQLCRMLPLDGPQVSRCLMVLSILGLAGGGSRPMAPGGGAALPAANASLRSRLEQVDPITAEAAESGRSGIEIRRAEKEKQTALDLLASGRDPKLGYRLLAQAVAIVPDADALIALAEIELGNRASWQRALEHLKQAAAIAPTSSRAWLKLAEYWRLREQPDKQRRCIEKALSLEPHDEQALDQLESLGG